MKRFFKLFLVFIFVYSYANDIVAKQLTPGEALSNARMANAKAKVKMRMSGNDEFSLVYTSSLDGLRCYYAFNKKNEGGFLIVSADDVAPAILGYTDSGSFDYEEIPENMKWWLSQYDRTISLAAVNNENIKRSGTKAPLKEIQPLIKTMWDQDAPYNNMCPIVYGKPTYTGCVATAMAQLMYYHKWPATGTGSNSYEINIGGQTVTPAADFGNTVYRWDDMLTTYEKGSYTSAQAEAVATLMYHCGVSANMKYGINSSGASTMDAMTALISYFNYDKALSYERRVFYTDDEWEEMIWNELDNNRPVFYEGATVKGEGHAFICDGYDGSGYYHFNWGWGGYCDGYFLITGTGALWPDGSGIGGGSAGYGYTERQACVIGIQEPKGSSDYRLQMECPNGYSIQLLSGSPVTSPITREEDLIFSGGIYNSSFSSFNVEIGLMFKATASDDVYYQHLTINKLDINFGFGSIQFKPAGVLTNGEYEVYPVFKPVDGSKDWELVKIPVGMEIPRITITGKEPGLILTQQAFIPDADNVKADNVEIHFTLKALETVKNQLIVAWIYSVEEGKKVEYMYEQASMEAGETRNFVLKGNFSDKLFASNTYCIRIQNNTTGGYLAPSDYGLVYFTVMPSSYINTIANETDKRVNVYYPTGIMIKSGVSESDALKDLPSGLYIVNGKKFLKK